MLIFLAEREIFNLGIYTTEDETNSFHLFALMCLCAIDQY